MKIIVLNTIILALLFFFIGCFVKRDLASDSEPKTVYHIVHMGQSLGAGEQSLPIVTGGPTGFGNYKFSMGTHTWNNEEPQLRSKDDFLFAPLVAQQRGGEGETVANGMCDHLIQTAPIEFSKNTSLLFSYAGQGGRFLRELDKEHDDAKDPRAGTRQSRGGYYRTSVDDVKRAKATSDSLGFSYSVFAISWMQGESESGFRLNRWDSVLSRKKVIETYKNDLIRLKVDFQNDVKVITGQKRKPPFFTYQTFGALTGTAQLMACDQENDMYMVAPTYMLPNAENGCYYVGDKLVHGDGIHLTADGERWLGEQFGKVIRKVNIEKQNWEPLRPLKAWYGRSRECIYIELQVPVAPLVIDTLFLPKQGNGVGFSIYDKENRVYEISDVSVTKDNVLKITMIDTLALDSDFFVSYGLNSYVAEVSSSIKFIDSNSVGRDGHKSVEIGFNGDIMDDFSILNQEGVFYLHNRTKGGQGYTSLIIREVYLDKNGNTVLKGELDDLREGVSFQIGQKCFTSRRFDYGNIRDSDNETSTFTFEDSTYGKRIGKRYPLWNWSIVFQDLAVKDL